MTLSDITKEKRLWQRGSAEGPCQGVPMMVMTKRKKTKEEPKSSGVVEEGIKRKRPRQVFSLLSSSFLFFPLLS